MGTLLGLFVSAFVVGFSGALVPGPMLAATIASVPRYGPWAGPWVVAGHGLAEAGVIAAIVLGLGKVLSKGRVLAAVGVLGGAGLVWFGWITLDLARTVSLAVDSRDVLTMHPFVAGIVTSVLNPYWLVWWATIGLSYVGLSRQHGLAGLSSFGVGHILSDAVWFTFVSTALFFGRSLIGDTVFRWLVGVCGVGLILFGFKFVWSGVRRWSSVAPASCEPDESRC